MWFALGALMTLSWVVFFIRARPLANTLDRCEVMVLKPLFATYLLLAIGLCISGAWLVGALSALAWLLNGALGAALHPSSSAAELAEGTIQYMRKGVRTPLSRDESRLLASVVLRATLILGIVMFALLIHFGLHWYVAVPAVFGGSWVFLAGSTIAVGYQKKASRTGTAI